MRLGLERAAAGEGEQLAGGGLAALHGLPHGGGDIREAAPLRHQLQPGGDDLQDVGEVVRDAAGKVARGFHLLRQAKHLGLARRRFREPPVAMGGDQADGGERQNCGDDGEGERPGIDCEPGMVARLAREHGDGRHAGIVHAGNRQREEACGRHPDPIVAEALERSPQGDGRGRDGYRDRERYERRRIDQAGGGRERRHAGIMHGDDGGAHEGPGLGQRAQARPPRDAPERHKGADHGEQHGKQRQVDAVADGHADREGEHGDEVHRPDAQPHDDGGSDQPSAPRRPGRICGPHADERQRPAGNAGLGPRRKHAGRKRQGGIRGDESHRDRDDHQTGVVAYMQHGLALFPCAL